MKKYNEEVVTAISLKYASAWEHWCHMYCGINGRLSLIHAEHVSSVCELQIPSFQFYCKSNPTAWIRHCHARLQECLDDWAFCLCTAAVSAACVDTLKTQRMMLSSRHMVHMPHVLPVGKTTQMG